MQKIVVLYGGISSEREISIETAISVAKNLFELGKLTYMIDTQNPDKILKITKISDLSLARETPPSNPNYRKLVISIDKLSPYKIFNALHGGDGENGKLQAFLDLLKIQYIGCGFVPSSLGMDKIVSKLLVQKYGVKTPDFSVYTADSNPQKIAQDIENNYQYPVVFKANTQGSSIGVQIIHSPQELIKIDELLQSGLDNKYLLEKYIPGRELSIPVINGKVYNPVELIPESDFYDYKHKYTEGFTKHICPAELTDKIVKLIKETATDIFNIFECNGHARMDFRLDKNNELYFLEINTCPGMTELSIVPESCNASGIDFKSLLQLLIDN